MYSLQPVQEFFQLFRSVRGVRGNMESAMPVMAYCIYETISYMYTYVGGGRG